MQDWPIGKPSRPGASTLCPPGHGVVERFGPTLFDTAHDVSSSPRFDPRPLVRHTRTMLSRSAVVVVQKRLRRCWRRRDGW